MPFMLFILTGSNAAGSKIKGDTHFKVLSSKFFQPMHFNRIFTRQNISTPVRAREEQSLPKVTLSFQLKYNSCSEHSQKSYFRLVLFRSKFFFPSISSPCNSFVSSFLFNCFYSLLKRSNILFFLHFFCCCWLLLSQKETSPFND